MRATRGWLACQSAVLGNVLASFFGPGPMLSLPGSWQYSANDMPDDVQAVAPSPAGPGIRTAPMCALRVSEKSPKRLHSGGEEGERDWDATLGARSRRRIPLRGAATHGWGRIQSHLHDLPARTQLEDLGPGVRDRLGSSGNCGWRIETVVIWLSWRPFGPLRAW